MQATHIFPVWFVCARLQKHRKSIVNPDLLFPAWHWLLCEVDDDQSKLCTGRQFIKRGGPLGKDEWPRLVYRFLIDKRDSVFRQEDLNNFRCNFLQFLLCYIMRFVLLVFYIPWYYNLLLNTKRFRYWHFLILNILSSFVSTRFLFGIFYLFRPKKSIFLEN